MQKILIDIDGTIAVRNIPHFVEACNTQLNLGMDQEQRPRSYKAFLRRQEVQEYIQRVGEEKSTRELAWMDLDPAVLVNMYPLPGAIESINQLAQHQIEIAYYTARSCWFDQVKHQVIMDATRQWLREKGFPNADKTVFCRNVADKLQRIADVIAQDQQSIVLIDDQYHRLQEAFRKSDAQTQSLLRSYLMLVAFGAESMIEMQEEPSLPCIGLPNWKQCNALGTLLVYS
jgi:uncharacterized HAD superfamily protein